jgi:hypothetical protein
MQRFGRDKTHHSKCLRAGIKFPLTKNYNFLESRTGWPATRQPGGTWEKLTADKR